MVEISIIGATISGNKGAESMFLSGLQGIKSLIPTAKINLFTYYLEADEQLNNHPNVTICDGTPLALGVIYPSLAIVLKIMQKLHLPTSFIERQRHFAALARSDLVIDMAGISFVDGRERYLPFNIACVLAPILLKKRILKYSQALGPFKNPVNRFCAKLILPRINCVIARGETTLQHLAEINLTNIDIAADAAFSLNVSNEAFMATEKYISEDFFDKEIVGVSPSSVIENYCRRTGVDYPRVIAGFIDYLTDCGYNVLLIPHSIRKNTLKRKNNDLIVSREIHDLVLDKRSCILIADDLGAEELRAIIGRCDYFIASRFHAMVSALAMKVPTIVCGWSHKYTEVLEMFQLEDCAFDYKDLELNMMVNKFNDLVRSQEIIKSKLERHLPDVIKSSEKNVLIARNLLEF
mgnify:CR=1 FL=1|jgi:polysaccharide pyruvyl transferase WcaK-like protein